MAHHFVAGESALWAQRDGPNTLPIYLGCHAIGDIDQPEGDVEIIYCPDPSGPNRFQAVGSLQGAAGAITTTVTTDVTDELDELERAKCPFTLFIHMSVSGRRDVFDQFDRTFVFENARITSRGITGVSALSAEDNTRSQMTFDISAESLLRLLEPIISTQTNIETSDISDITFCNEERCRTSEDVAQDSCQVGFAATLAPTGSPSTTANVLYTSNGGSWSATGADPFAATEDISGIECFELGRDSIRVIVARGTADVANPAEIAYSDDNGVNWTAIDVGSTNGQYAPTRFSLHAINRYNIFLGTNDGYIYKSIDAGLTWAAIESAGIHSGAWNAIRFIDENVGWAGGAANILAKTLDGGASWSTVTGPTAEAASAVTVVEVLDRNRVWVGYSSGRLYYTLDGGTTWSERAFTGSGVGQIRDIKFLSENQGYLATDNASPLGKVHWSVNGGYTWAALTTPTNAGLNVLALCDAWSFFVCGNAYGGEGYIAKGAI